MNPTPLDRDRCDRYLKARLACRMTGDVKEADPEKAAAALGRHLDALDELTAAAAALKPSLIRRRIDHAGWRFYLDKAGVIHCVKMPVAAIMAGAGRSSR